MQNKQQQHQLAVHAISQELIVVVADKLNPLAMVELSTMKTTIHQIMTDLLSTTSLEVSANTDVIFNRCGPPSNSSDHLIQVLVGIVYQHLTHSFRHQPDFERIATALWKLLSPVIDEVGMTWTPPPAKDLLKNANITSIDTSTLTPEQIDKLTLQIVDLITNTVNGIDVVVSPRKKAHERSGFLRTNDRPRRNHPNR